MSELGKPFPKKIKTDNATCEQKPLARKRNLVQTKN